jgi:acyl-CoA reductase-like NAD-dependent aldehyde dehydrogenase
MISIRDAERAMEWIAEAEKSGAKVHCGNKREGSVVWPTVLTNVTRDMKVTKDETFAPIVSVVPFDTMEEAYAMVNDSRYGLNSGILTNDLSVAMEAIRKLKTGGVIVGGTCGFRFGNMPYGGIKESGIGREAPKYAIEEMTEMKTVVILN